MPHKIPHGTGNNGGHIYYLCNQTFDSKVWDVVLPAIGTKLLGCKYALSFGT